MFERLKIARRNRGIVDDLYAALVERSRRPVHFLEHGIEDTVLGRFESLSLHVFLFLRRCRDDEALKSLAQDLVDRFMADVEDSIREIGIGDVAVPKRMRKLAGMFYERVAAYDPPVAAKDRDALAAALPRRALAATAPKDAAGRLASYMLATTEEWNAVATAAILRGTL